VKALVVISDLHIGSTVGLCPPQGLEVADKGLYKPNKFQLTLWKYWKHFWTEYVPASTAGAEKVYLVVNGDAIDGVHHKTINIISGSWEAQESAAVQIVGDAIKMCPVQIDGLYWVKGTDAHVDVSGQAEERVAKALGAEPNDIGEFASYQWWLEADGVSFQIAHHIGTTSSAAYESSAPMREMVAGLVEAAQWERRMPDVIVRSHRHRFIPVSIPSIRGRINSVITPAWQLRTPFVERIDRMRMPHIGGVVFTVEDGVCQIREKLYPLPEQKIRKI
jgi:hypothetical protein